VISLAACGGSSNGGSGSGPEGTGDPEPVATGVKPGVYSTTIAGDATPQAFTLVSSSGEYGLFANARAGTFGTLALGNGEPITGNGANVFFDEIWQSVDGTLDVNVINSEEFTAAFTAAGSDPGAGSDVTASRINELSNRGLTMQALSDTYFLSDTDRDTGVVSQTASVTIDADGTVTGSESVPGSDPDKGCIISGTVSIPDTAVNILEGNLSFTNCATIDSASSQQRNGDYRVIGYLLRFDAGAKRLVFAGTNNKVMSLFSGDN